jgi:AraC family transcriptional regulator, regulatory protein of adaptative response / methylated-DNA-[protein]-cysteine methyltransferase
MIRIDEVVAVTGDAIRFTVGKCALGSILVAVSRTGLRAVSFGDDPETVTRELRDAWPGAYLIADGAGLKPILREVVAFVENPAIGLDLPLDPRGSTSSSASGRRCARSRPVRRRAMARSPGASAPRRTRMPSPRRARQTRLQSPFPATASCARTAPSPATAGDSSASGRCSSGRGRDDRRA